MYDSRVGRFLSEDPIGFDAGDPNLYRYVGNNPVTYNDPTGLQINPGQTFPSSPNNGGYNHGMQQNLRDPSRTRDLDLAQMAGVGVVGAGIIAIKTGLAAGAAAALSRLVGGTAARVTAPVAASLVALQARLVEVNRLIYWYFQQREHVQHGSPLWNTLTVRIQQLRIERTQLTERIELLQQQLGGR